MTDNPQRKDIPGPQPFGGGFSTQPPSAPSATETSEEVKEPQGEVKEEKE